MKISFIKILIILFLFNLIYSHLNLKSNKIYESLEEHAVEFDFFKTVRFNTNTNKYFKFTKENNEIMNLIIYIRRRGDEVRVTDSNGNNIEENIEDDDYDEQYFIFNITAPGVYLLEFFNPEVSNPFAVDNEFTALLPGNFIDTIDFSKKMYYNSIYLTIYQKINFEPFKYKVKNLKKDTFVYFIYGRYSHYSYDEDYFKKYYENPFEICHEQICERNVSLYHFSKDIEYTINIHFSHYFYYDYDIYYFPFVFFPIDEDTIQTINKGLHKSDEPKIYNFDFKDSNYLKGLQLNCKYFFTFYSDEIVTLENLNNIFVPNLNMKSERETFILKKNEAENLIMIAIPPITINEFMDNSTRIVIVDSIINNVEKQSITIPPGNDTLIYLDEDIYDDEDDYDYDYDDDSDYEEPDHISIYNVLRAYSSTEKNLQYVMSDKIEEFDFLIENSYKHPIYIKKSENEAYITIESFYPRYAFFGAATKELYKSYLSFFLRSSYGKDESEKAGVPIDAKRFSPINIRVNSNLNNFYDVFNFYIKDFEENVNVYINKIYGETELYECSDDSIDFKNLSFLTTPITNCKNKRSLFNRLFSFKGNNKLLSGYLSPNSYFDVYIEYNDDENNIIKIPSVSENTVNSASKYIRKDIEYKIDFDVDHMVKIEPKHNIEIIIYNKDETIILNTENPASKVEGKDYFVRTNIDTMIYFYGKLNSYIKQIRIDPEQKGKNIRIKSNYREIKFYYCFDTGFEGYNPLNSEMKNRVEVDVYDENIYIENIYEKIKNKLVKNENLYFFYGNRKVNEAKIKLEYLNETVANPNNDYTFHVIPQNSKDKSLVLKNTRYYRIEMGVHLCKAQNEVKIYAKKAQDSYDSGERRYIFYPEDNEYKEIGFDDSGILLRFESNEDFIFSYSYYDKTDSHSSKDDWEEERNALSDLNITNIIDNPESNIISIEFNPNYIKSTTKYIIIVASEGEDNSYENFNNPCYIAKLATDKPSGVKIENFFSAGEDNNTITVQVDISDVINSNNDKYIVNIISQELRFEKKLNFYTPKKFIHKENAKNIEIGTKTVLDLSNNKAFYNLQLNESPQEDKILLLYYKLDNENPLTVKINNPDNQVKSFNIINKEGFISFVYNKNGIYGFHFKNNDDNEKLRNNNNAITGEFSIISTESPFNLNLKNDNIEFKEFTINAKNNPVLKFNIGPLDKDYTKKFVISNYNFENIKEIVSIKKNKDELKPLNFNYYTFEKDSEYEVEIKFHKKDNENYILEKFNILDYSSLNIEDIFSNTKKYNDINDKFYIINWKKIEKILITKINKNPNLLLSHIEENQQKNLVKELQNIEFKQLDNLEITKPNNIPYSVLMIELTEFNTEINVELKLNNNSDGDIDDSDDDDDDDKTIYIIVISILGGILLIILLILIIKCIQKGKGNQDIEEKTQNIKNEKLLQDI